MLIDGEGDGFGVGDGAAGCGDGVVVGSGWCALRVGVGSAAAAGGREEDCHQEGEETSGTDDRFSEAATAGGEEHQKAG